MNRIALAGEVVKLAKEIVSIEFGTEAEKKKYQNEHDVRPGTKLTVKKKSQTPGLNPGQHAENAIRDHLSGTGRVTTKEKMMTLLKRGGHDLTKGEFSGIWDSLVKDQFLVKTPGGKYTWEI
jgi:hypothetical protein